MSPEDVIIIYVFVTSSLTCAFLVKGLCFDPVHIETGGGLKWTKKKMLCRYTMGTVVSIDQLSVR